MRQYLQQLREILTSPNSYYKPNRTDVDTISLFGYQAQYDLSEGFPLLTTKKMAVKGIIHELIWFLRGDTNIKYLLENNVHIWDGNAFQSYLERNGISKKYPMYSPEWNKIREEYLKRILEDENFAKEQGDLGPVYGRQWKKWKTPEGKMIDQIENVINLLKKSPQSRRIIVTAWNPGEIESMALPPCHVLFHFNVTSEGKLDCQLYQRSADTFLGVPFNLASYSLLTYIMAEQADLKPGRFIHTFGDTHIYCGKGKRGKFYGENLEELKRKVREARTKEDYLAIIDWIEQNAPPEESGEVGQDHITAVLEQLSRDPLPLPKIEISPGKRIDKLTIDDFNIVNYQHHEPIKRSMAV